MAAGVRAGCPARCPGSWRVSNPQVAGVRCGVRCVDALARSVSAVSERWCGRMRGDPHALARSGASMHEAAARTLRSLSGWVSGDCTVRRRDRTLPGSPTVDRTAGRPGRPGCRAGIPRQLVRGLGLPRLGKSDGQSADRAPAPCVSPTRRGRSFPLYFLCSSQTRGIWSSTSCAILTEEHTG